jgi:hypothetical protein
VSKQAAVASIVFVDVQIALLDNLGSSNQCCCDGRIANVWQRLDEITRYRIALEQHPYARILRQAFGV